MRKLFFLLMLVIPLFVFSQDDVLPTFTISGKIIDANSKKPINYATVVFKSIDSGTIKFGGITNHRGVFSIDIKKGIYATSIECMAYKSKTITVSATNSDYNIGTIQLEIDTENLEEIEILGEVGLLSIKQNKQVYNVSKDVSSKSVSATEILTNIPTLSIGADGNIAIKGQGNVTILIDGKMSSLSKMDALKSIPAASIDKIEVIANPGASYRSSATGIINIILKKGKNEGLNSSVTASGGYKDIYGGLLTLNYKSKKVNFYTNISYAHSNLKPLIEVENEYFSDGITTGFLTEKTDIERPSDDFMAIIGADFYLSKNSTLTASFKYDNIDKDNKYTTNSSYFDENHNLTETNTGKNDGGFTDEIFEATLNYQHNFKKEGQTFTGYIQYSEDKESYSYNFINSNPIFEDDAYIEENTLKNTEISLKYAHPISETSSFEVGYLGTFGDTPYTYKSESISRKVIYTDYIHGFFIDFEKSWEKFYLGIGLRAEFAEIETDFTNLNSTQTKNFNDLFPSVYFEYTINDSQTVDISYSRSTERPGYNELLPFERKFSETLSYIGNINLDPMYVNALNFSYSYSAKNISIVPTLYWYNYQDLMQNISFSTETDVVGVDKIWTTFENIGTLDFYGLNLTLSVKASKWLSFVGNANIYTSNRTGIYQYTNPTNEIVVQDFDFTDHSGEFSLLTKIKIPKAFDFQFNVQNQLTSEAAYSKRYTNTYVNAAINRDFLNNNASISLAVDDVFNSKKLHRDRFELDYNSNRIKTLKYQSIILSFTYRFNQNKQNRSVDFDRKKIKSHL